MDKRLHGPSGPKGTSATPDIALELIRTAACCSVVADALRPFPGLPLSELVASVSAEFSTRTVGTNEDVVTQTLSTLAYSHVTKTRRSAEAEFARLCRSETRTFRTDESQVAALARAGILVPDVTPKTLTRLRKHEAVRVLEQIQDLTRLEAWILDGAMAAAIEYTYDETKTKTGLDGAVAELAKTGLDAESLCWAIITFETNRHINLVWHFANRLTKTFPDRVPADLFGWGWQGLRVALRNFDPDRGFLFSTYAATRISGAIRDGVRSESPVPKRLTTYLRKIVKAEEDLTQELGRVPSLKEVAAHLGEDLEQLRIVPRLAPAASIDEITDESRDRGGAPSWLVVDDDPALKAIASARAEAVAEAMGTLSDEDRQAVKLLVMDGLDPREARELTGIDTRLMRRRKERGLAALASHLSEWREDAAVS